MGKENWEQIASRSGWLLLSSLWKGMRSVPIKPHPPTPNQGVPFFYPYNSQKKKICSVTTSLNITLTPETWVCESALWERQNLKSLSDSDGGRTGRS